MELIKVLHNTFYFSGPANIGMILTGKGRAVLIDTGIDQQTAKKVLKELEHRNLMVAAIINTHSHADHIGGNRFLQGRLGVPVYASSGEAPFIADPELEPLYLLGGATPWKEMKNKFLCAQPSTVNHIIRGGDQIIIEDLVLVAHPLPGHSHDQIGIWAEGVLFSGDAFLAPEYLQKHGIPYNVDIAGYLNSLELLLCHSSTVTVPSHGEAVGDPEPHVRANRKIVLEQVEMVGEIISKAPSTIEGVVEKLCGKLHFSISLPALYFLYRTTVTAYLGYLLKNNVAKHYMEGNKLYWTGG